MLRNRYVIVLTLVLALSVALPGAVLAQHTTPTAIAPNVWSPVRHDGPMWSSFAVGNLEEDLLSEVTIRLESRPIHGASFEVLVSGDWGYWDTLESDDWFGMSTETDYGDAEWTGALPAGGYFVHVDPAGAQEVKLTISGSVVYDCECVDVHYQPRDTFTVEAKPVAAAPAVAKQAAPAPVATVQAAPAPVAASQVAPAPALTMAAKYNPGPTPAMSVTWESTDMAMLPGVWMANDDNSVHWFTFYVDGIDGQISNHVTIALSATPVGGGSFEIFDSVGACYWDEPEQDTWIGASSVHEDGTISWTGDLTPGAYYVRMEPEGVQSCLLAISGEAIRY